MIGTRPGDWPLAVKEWLWRLAVALAVAAFAWYSRGADWGVVRKAAPMLLKGIGISFLLAIFSVIAGMILGTVLAVARTSAPFGIRHAAIGFIEIIRAVPQLMVIFWVFFTWPALTGTGMSPWAAALLSLTVIAAAYLAEIVRAGLQSVPRIQRESAFATGLSSWQTFSRVVLPQALRNMLPALIATFVMMFKVTSLVYVVGIIDFFRAVIIVNNRDFAPYALYTTLAVGYFVCCYALSWLVRKLDPKYALTT
jgi:His/Glu/Gln/Arg/opine family amino acid ABC transporter permease subunit